MTAVLVHCLKKNEESIRKFGFMDFCKFGYFSTIHILKSPLLKLFVDCRMENIWPFEIVSYTSISQDVCKIFLEQLQDEAVGTS